MVQSPWVSEDGQWSKTEVGTPQGAVISPLLANVYLHYVLDLWTKQWRTKIATGDLIIVRYADDFVVGFQYRSDAERFLQELGGRMQKFGLALHPDKTRLIEFGRFAAENRQKRGDGKPETFTFLGFTHICGRKRQSRGFIVKRKTAAKRLRAKVKEVKERLFRQHHDPIDAAGLDVIGWNDLTRLEARLAKGDIAGVIMEPAMCNQGAIQAAPGYLEGAKAACAKHGAILIFDEVITGFRLGRSGAQARFGVTPDMSLVAKAVANGFPVAALVGRADLLDMFVTGGVLHGGTFNAQPVTMAAMVATQAALTPEGYESTSKRGVRLRDGICDILKSAGVKAQVTGFELMFHVGLGLDAPAKNYRDLLKTDKALYVKFAHALLKRGVRVLERGAWFVSFAHDDAVIDATLAAVKEAAKEIA